MLLHELIHEIDELPNDELETLYLYIQQRREQREQMLDDRHPAPLDIDGLKDIFAELREGFSAEDLDKLDWAMNVEVIEPLEDAT